MDISHMFLALGSQNLLVALLGTAAGIILGALPGVGTILSVTLFLPFTFALGAEQALILLGGVFGGAVYGGSISAILINIPGTAASVVTSLDGYPLAKKGKAGYALGISTMSSALGGLVGTFALILISPLLAKIALQFGPREFFMLALMGIIMISRASPQDTLKGLVSGGLGLMIGTIGLSALSAYPRFTFGVQYFYGGVSLVPTVIGLFGFSEILMTLEMSDADVSIEELSGGVLAGALYPFRKLVTLLKSIVLGIIIGAIPGVGGEVSNTIAYLEAKRASSHPETFGEGEPEGLVAAESANNASVSSSLIPMLTLGIPGSAVAALFSGALLIHGLKPGLSFFTNNPDILGAFFGGLIIANIMLLILGLLGAPLWAKAIKVSRQYLLPAITLLCLTGAFAVHNSIADMVYAFILGFIGYVMRRGGYSIPCLLIGFVMGGITEEAFGQGMLIGRGSGWYFLQSPWAVAFLLASVAILAQPWINSLIQSGRKRGEN
jgi:putative tricarboxylic transport membrane protein